MDLIFRRKDYFPRKSFLNDYPAADFGQFSKFEVKIKFKNNSQWDLFSYDFLVDTGAYISVAPDFLMDRLNINLEFESSIFGIILREECKLDVKIGKADFKIIDENEKESQELSAWFAFHPLESGPFLFGMKNLLAEFGMFKEINDDSLVLKMYD